MNESNTISWLIVYKATIQEAMTAEQSGGRVPKLVSRDRAGERHVLRVAVIARSRHLIHPRLLLKDFAKYLVTTAVHSSETLWDFERHILS